MIFVAKSVGGAFHRQIFGVIFINMYQNGMHDIIVGMPFEYFGIFSALGADRIQTRAAAVDVITVGGNQAVAEKFLCTRLAAEYGKCYAAEVVCEHGNIIIGKNAYPYLGIFITFK